MTILISQTDIREADIRSSIFQAIGRDEDVLKSIEEYVHVLYLNIMITQLLMCACVIQFETVV